MTEFSMLPRDMMFVSVSISDRMRSISFWGRSLCQFAGVHERGGVGWSGVGGLGGMGEWVGGGVSGSG